MSDFKRMMVRNVELNYPRLDQTYRYSRDAGKSVPVEIDAEKALWETSFILDKERGVKLWKDAQAHYEDCKKNGMKFGNKPMGKFDTVHGYKELDDGRIQFKAKKFAKNKQGKIADIPRLIDGQKRPLENRAIWSGSIGSVRFSMLPTSDNINQRLGVTFYLDAVQVLDAKYGGDGLDDFEMVEDQAATDIAGLPKVDYDTSTDNEFDDEIPF